MEMTSRQKLDAVDKALAEVARQLASGELDQSGRYYTDEQLADHAAIRGDVVPNCSTAAASAKAESPSKALSR